MKKLIGLICLIIISGCNFMEDIDFLEKKNPSISMNESISNETINQTNQSQDIQIPNENLNPEKTYYFISQNSILIAHNNLSVVVDAGDYNAKTIIEKYGLDVFALILTTNNFDKYKLASNYILTLKPHIVIDNGLQKEREKYLQHTGILGVKTEIVNRKKSITFGEDSSIDFYPAEKLMFDDASNSMPIKIKRILYMSDCYGNCQDKIDSGIDIDYIVLANNGACPTNDYEFVVLTGAKKIIGTELCPDFYKEIYLDNEEDLKNIGIEFLKIEGILKLEEGLT